MTASCGLGIVHVYTWAAAYVFEKHVVFAAHGAVQDRGFRTEERNCRCTHATGEMQGAAVICNQKISGREQSGKLSYGQLPRETFSLGRARFRENTCRIFFLASPSDQEHSRPLLSFQYPHKRGKILLGPPALKREFARIRVHHNHRVTRRNPLFFQKTSGPRLCIFGNFKLRQFAVM